MDDGLPGKRVVLTGGTRGIGRATTLALARAGATVVTCYHSDTPAAADLETELSALGGDHRVVKADVTDPTGVEALVELAADALGEIDVLVNNVGVDGVSPFGALDLAEWHRVLDGNLTSAYLMTRTALPVMGAGGAVVCVGSSVASRGRPHAVHYTAAKAALTGFTRALCKELGPRGIRVNTVSPGVIETEPGAPLPLPVAQRLTAMTALGRLGRPEDVAAAVLFLAGDSARYVTGATLTVDGGM